MAHVDSDLVVGPTLICIHLRSSRYSIYIQGFASTNHGRVHGDSLESRFIHSAKFESRSTSIRRSNAQPRVKSPSNSVPASSIITVSL